MKPRIFLKDDAKRMERIFTIFFFFIWCKCESCTQIIFSSSFFSLSVPLAVSIDRILLLAFNGGTVPRGPEKKTFLIDFWHHWLDGKKARKRKSLWVFPPEFPYDLHTCSFIFLFSRTPMMLTKHCSTAYMIFASFWHTFLGPWKNTFMLAPKDRGG